MSCVAISTFPLLTEGRSPFSTKKFLGIMIPLIFIVLVDSSFIKIYDIIEKSLIPIQTKLMIFGANGLLCISLQYILIRYLVSSWLRNPELKKRVGSKTFSFFYLVIILTLGALISSLTLQMVQREFYHIIQTSLIIVISYGSAAAFIIRLSLLFFSWYRANRNLVILLYSVSIALIAFNFIATATVAVVKINDRPDLVRQYIGGSADISAGRYPLLDNIYSLSSLTSFILLWITTMLLMSGYRSKPVNVVIYWTVLSLPLVYFLIAYFYRFIFGSYLDQYLLIDPIGMSILLTTFLSLSKPIGGLLFGVAFWNISRTLRHEWEVRTSMVISGWGILLIFGANQATVQALAPYPPFGIATITLLPLGAYLVLLGLYFTARQISGNASLRRLIGKHVIDLKLLDLIGQAETEKVVQKTVTEVMGKAQLVDPESKLELKDDEIKSYLDSAMREVQKGRKK